MDARRAVHGLWGKSKGLRRPLPLTQHLLDTCAVGERLWDGYLAPAVRDAFDGCTEGTGRNLLRLVCAVHDVGKASPAFQLKEPGLCVQLSEAGLALPVGRMTPATARTRPHTLAGAHILDRVLRAAGWPASTRSWFLPLISGHHGVVPPEARVGPRGRGRVAQGKGDWETVQDALVAEIAAHLSCDLAVAAPRHRPDRAHQLAFLGILIMADWIASDGNAFPDLPLDRLVGLDTARDRAHRAWESLGLRGGWTPTALQRPTSSTGIDHLFRTRFDLEHVRPLQRGLAELATGMPVPGLILVEAPTGEGKTEAALAAAEILAARFGADGIFVGMPTQATSDPMLSRVADWSARIDQDVPVALLHGRARFNAEWQEMIRRTRFVGIEDSCHGSSDEHHGIVDEFGLPDEFGTPDDFEPPDGSSVPENNGPSRGTVPGAPVHRTGRDLRGPAAAADWFLGPKRGLLTPVAVGTVDHLLHAATRTRHVMLRQTGLTGRIVILDEIHSYDSHMGQFLREALRWLAGARVPVVLLSATVEPGLRHALAESYLQGALGREDTGLPRPLEPTGYPGAIAVHGRGGRTVVERCHQDPWRPASTVAVTILDEPVAPSTSGSHDRVVEHVLNSVQHGGCVLVVCNTVDRAQDTYQALRTDLGPDAVLLHARLTAGERATRTRTVLDLLGPAGRSQAPPRPRRLVVVATQLAEQSFDVDVDHLVTDLAPIDLLLQRAGRLHRHRRAPARRPGPLRRPRIVVTGVSRHAEGPPTFPGGSRAIYGDHLLLRSAALCEQAATGHGWTLPGDVPDLVGVGYDPDPAGLPRTWRPRADRALAEHVAAGARRTANAQQYLLTTPDTRYGPDNTTLAGLHAHPTADLPDEDAVSAVVRDGEQSVEAVPVLHDPDLGTYRTLTGHPLGPTGERSCHDHIVERILHDTLRLPGRREITAAALAELRPLPGWTSHPWLRTTRALVLDDDRTCVLGDHELTYDDDLGLLCRRKGSKP